MRNNFLFAWGLLYQVVRTRMREQAAFGAFKYKGFVNTLQTIAREEGRRCALSLVVWSSSVSVSVSVSVCTYIISLVVCLGVALLSCC